MWRESACAAVLMVSMGCAKTAQGPVTAWNPKDSPGRAVSVTQQGQYALLTTDSDLPLYVTQLDAGEAVGFQRTEDGRLMGRTELGTFPLDGLHGTSFYWDYRGPDTAEVRR